MRRYEQMTEDMANRVYDVLVEHAGASEYWRRDFVHYQSTSEHGVDEYRFQGALGFGGKFWRNSGRRDDDTWGEMWYVNAYRENETPEILEMIERTNAALDVLLGEHLGVEDE